MKKDIISADPVCFGVCCRLHAGCARYHAVEGSRDDQPRIANCGPRHSAFISFVPASRKPAHLVAEAA